MLTLQIWIVMLAIWPGILVSSGSANQSNTVCNFVGLLCESMTVKKRDGKYLVYSITHISCSRVNNEGQMKISEKPPRKDLIISRQDLGSVNVKEYVTDGKPRRWSKERILMFTSIREAVAKTCLVHTEIKTDKTKNYPKQKEISQSRQRDNKTEKGYTRLTAGKDTIYVKRYELKKTWDEALKVCRSDGGSLVKIDTKEKMEQIRKSMSETTDVLKKFYMWIALRDFDQNNVFRWIDGSSVNYSAWANHEPHNVVVDESGTRIEDCGALVYKLVYGLEWNDQCCENENGFLCEISEK